MIRKKTMPLGDSNKQITKSTGFTLLELMIIIAVMGILSAIAIPAFTSMLPGMRLNGAARMVMGDLMAARMKAVKENNNYKVTFMDDGRQYEIWDDDGSDGADHDSETTSDDIKDIQDTYDGVTISSNINPIFYPRGTVNNVGTITLTNSSGSKDITVIRTGRVKIQ